MLALLRGLQSHPSLPPLWLLHALAILARVMIKGEPHLVLTIRANATILVLPVAHTFSRCSSHIAVFTKLYLNHAKSKNWCQKRDSLELEGPATNWLMYSTINPRAECREQKPQRIKNTYTFGKFWRFVGCISRKDNRERKERKHHEAKDVEIGFRYHIVGIRSMDLFSPPFSKFSSPFYEFSSQWTHSLSNQWVVTIKLCTKAWWFLIGRSCSSPILKDHCVLREEDDILGVHFSALNSSALVAARQTRVIFQS